MRAAASTSLIEIRLPLPVENTFAVFGWVDWVAGTELTGASLTAVTLNVNVLAEASRSTPLLAVPPVSWTWKVNEA